MRDGGSTQQLGSFLKELRRREVFQTAGIYAASAWLFTEITLAFIDRSPMPESSKALVACGLVSVFIGGFPIALILAWFFDLTRRGVTRDQPIARGSNINAMSALALVIVAAAAVMWSVNPCGLGRILGIAVLPCSYNGDPEFDYQAPGVARELNYRLSHLPQLHVPANVAVDYFSERIVDPVKLSTVLGADRLVECGLRRSNERLSLNLQLYDPGSKQSLWTNEYVGQASDELFLIADVFHDLTGAEAINIAARAGSRLERVNLPPTSSSDAWILFQRARQAEALSDFEEALSLYSKVSYLDEDFSRAGAAWGRLLWLSTFSPDFDPKEKTVLTEVARGLLHDAEIDVTEPADLLANLMYAMASGVLDSSDKTQAGAAVEPEALHEKIISIRPSYTEEYVWWGAWLQQNGRDEEARAAFARAKELDPSGEILRLYNAIVNGTTL